MSGGLDFGSLFPRPRKHRLRNINARDINAGTGDRDGQPPGAAGKLQNRPPGFFRRLNVKRDISRIRGVIRIVMQTIPVNLGTVRDFMFCHS